MTLIRTRLTRDGKIRVKISGRRRKIFEVFFLDRYRKKSFRNLRYVLERFNIKVIEEMPIMRRIDVDYEDKGIFHSQQVEVEDKVLHSILNPRTETREICPHLKREYTIVFRYDGKGTFDLSTLGNSSEEEEADIEKFAKYLLMPEYQKAFLKDRAIWSKQPGEDVEPAEKADAVLEEYLTETSKTEEVSVVNAETISARKKKLRMISKNKIDDITKEMPAIEEIKEKIRYFQPTNFREKVAYERYLQALSTDSGKKEDIQRLFYELVVRSKNFEDFYRRLYFFAPRTLQRLQVPY